MHDVYEFGLKISSLAENQPSPTGFDSKDVDGEPASPGQGVDSENGGQQAEDANEEADGAASNSEREGENDNGSEEEEESGGTKSKTGNLKSILGGSRWKRQEMNYWPVLKNICLRKLIMNL